MSMQAVEINGATLLARASGAAWWPERRLLCVSDLHLGKSARLARRGGSLIPPYETEDTLRRLEAEIDALAPRTVVCLGDSFDDSACAASLPPEAAAWLGAMMAEREWIWIEGNHDRGAVALGGTTRLECRIGALVFRHAAEAGTAPGEVSGHYHPKIRIRARGAALARKCFLADARRLMLPAFGSYTGGLWTDDPALAALFPAAATAVLVGEPCLSLPLDAARRRNAPRRSRLAG